MRILLTSVAVSSLGLNTPVLYLVDLATLEGVTPSDVELLQVSSSVKESSK